MSRRKTPIVRAVAAHAPPAAIADRLARVRSAMPARRLDALLVWNPFDQYWLTGFSGEDGGVILTQDRVLLLTDSRFDETAQIECPWAQKLIRKQRTPEVTAAAMKRLRLGRVGFDAGHLSVAHHAALAKAARPVRLVATPAIIAPLRAVKDSGEIECIRRAVRLAEQAFVAVRDEVRVGVSEREIAARLTFEMTRGGADGDAFEQGPIVAFGSNGSLPHYRPRDRVLGAGDGALIDWGARSGGYVSDLTRMLWPTSIPAQLRDVHRVVQSALERAISTIKPGVKAVYVDRVARDVIDAAGFGERFGHALGHGIGLQVHESPRLGKRSVDVLKPGMIVTVEPGIYLPGIGGVRIEDDVLVTESGHEVLSTLPRGVDRT